MLHLPEPHHCPACGGTHRASVTERPAAAQLRPYFATYTPSKFPPAAVDAPAPVYDASSFPSGAAATQLAHVTADRTGWWAFSYSIKISGGTSDTFNLEARYNGVQQFSDGWAAANTAGTWAAGLGGHAMLNNAQVLSVWGSHVLTGGYNVAAQVLKAWFVPMSTYPQ